MTRRLHILVAAVAAASWCSAPAFAQDTAADASQDVTGQTSPPADTSPQSPDPSTESETRANTAATAPPLDDKKIEQFADAYLAVQTIQQKAAGDLQTAKDPAEADKVKASAESAMISAVEQSGLQVDEFNQIVETMTADANVRSRVAAKLQERSGGS
jgi:hypothetical protein